LAAAAAALISESWAVIYEITPRAMLRPRR
jgi:hypothetical protein